MNEKGILFVALGAAAVVISLLIGFVTGCVPLHPARRRPVGLIRSRAVVLPEASRGPGGIPCPATASSIRWDRAVAEPGDGRTRAARDRDARLPLGVLGDGVVASLPYAAVTCRADPSHTKSPGASSCRADICPSHRGVGVGPTGTWSARRCQVGVCRTDTGPGRCRVGACRSNSALPHGRRARAGRSDTCRGRTCATVVDHRGVGTTIAQPAEAPVGHAPSGQDEEQPNGDTGGRWHADLGALATAAAAAGAAEIVLGSAAVDAGTTKQRLAAELGWPRTDSTGTVRWCAQDVDLQPADPDDADRLRTLSQLRKQVQVWQQEREHELNVRRYLGEDVLTTTGSALVWWLARHLDDVPGAIGMVDDLSKLSAVSQDREDHGRAGGGPVAPPPTFVGSNGGRGIEPDIAATLDLLERLFPGSDDERMMFARDLAMIAERSGRIDYARRVPQDVRRAGSVRQSARAER